jgi:RecJ-like exonuclease
MKTNQKDRATARNLKCILHPHSRYLQFETIADAELAENAINEHDALNAVAEATRAFNSRAFTIASCPKCGGSGKQNPHDACHRCGGTGEIVEQDIFSEDLRQLHKAQAHLASIRQEGAGK